MVRSGCTGAPYGLFWALLVAASHLSLVAVAVFMTFVLYAQYIKGRAISQKMSPKVNNAAVDNIFIGNVMKEDLKEDDDHTPLIGARISRSPSNDFNLHPFQPQEGDQFDPYSIQDDEKTMDYSGDGNDPHSAQFHRDSEDTDFELVMRRSIVDPRVLVGWEIALEDGRMGVITSTVKKKFFPTKFSVELSDGSSTVLPLQRSPKKGSVSFKLLEKIK
jgi:hypothetical protein